ncbi:hypothetical protein BDV93DRAFT_601490 [Ceratobasidium sp. AG-I]|nr:hypothetical protein BDV93DRAFT_601490 [Ceratobasidium sp. AG-I]
MAAYASPPRSTGDMSPAASAKSVLESTFQALSQAPPPTIREILGAYSTKGEGDRDMLVALLNAKSAEDQRIAALATLQQTVLQMQHSLAVAQAQAQAQQLHGQTPPAPNSPHQLPSPRDAPSPLIPAQRKRSRAPASSGPVRRRSNSRSPSVSPLPQHYEAPYAYSRPHPYAQSRPQEHAYPERRHEEREWAPRRTWTSMSSERSTSEEGSGRE